MKIFIVLTLVDKNVINTHLLEVHHIVAVLLHLVLDGGNLGGKVLLAFDKPTLPQSSLCHPYHSGTDRQRPRSDVSQWHDNQ